MNWLRLTESSLRLRSATPKSVQITALPRHHTQCRPHWCLQQERRCLRPDTSFEGVS
ncbi:hypothetical protein BDZ89DRAFT_1062603 [Hymenopellis radicata]|nr:hypothetical protein BDZ89DRAFT_1062603 [Hymenopellis radicata]